MKNTEYTLYLDMDGVLVDFNAGYRDLANGRTIEEVEETEGEKEARRRYLAAGASFWANLPWAYGGLELWRSAQELFERVCILSSMGTTDPERGLVVRAGKLQWLANNLNPQLPESRIFIVPRRFYKKDKAAHDAILVDDMKDTIKDWNAAGGYGILHKDTRYKKTIYELEDIAAPLNLTEIVKHIHH